MKSEYEPNNEVKRVLKRNDEIEMPMDDAFFDRLHDKIMAATAQTEIQKLSPFHRPKRILRAHWKSWVISAVSVMTIFAAMQLAPTMVRQYIDGTHVVQVVRNEDDFLFESTQSPESFSDSLISLQNENDFYTDVAEKSFHDLSQKHVREIMGETGP